MIKSFNIFANNDEISVRISAEVRGKMEEAGAVYREDEKGADLIFCIGGDGALLRLLRQYDFPEAPIVGINTGHVGFFQEITMDGFDEFIRMLKEGNYHIQENSALSAEICTDSGIKNITAINEIVIRGEGERLMHLDMSIGDNYISRFSGDGILICTPAGSTAYNYSLGGVIVDPEVDMLQITPMAPVNNSAYRSFTSGIIVPTNKTIEILPAKDEDRFVVVIEDGRIVARDDVRKVTVRVAEGKARIVRFRNYNFWSKVKDKIL